MVHLDQPGFKKTMQKKLGFFPFSWSSGPLALESRKILWKSGCLGGGQSQLSWLQADLLIGVVLIGVNCLGADLLDQIHFASKPNSLM